MRHLTIILAALLAACQPQPVVTPIPEQSLTRQEIDSEALWDAAHERIKQLESESAEARQARFTNLEQAIKEMK